MNTRVWSSFINVRLLTVMILGFASGLPLVLTGSTLQAWFTEAQVNLVSIGALSLIGIPYTLKFIWAPLMDYVRFPRFGGRRGWILIAQGGLVAALFLMAQLQPSAQLVQMYLLAFVIAFLAASQDVAIDAYRTDILRPDERGLGAAYYVFAYRMALLVSGGLGLILAEYVGWKTTYEIMACLMVAAMVVSYFAPHEVDVKSTAHSFVQTMVAAWQNLLQRDRIVYLLLFLIFYKFGDALAFQLMSNFLLKELGFSLVEIGVAYKLVSLIAMVLGGFVGGVILLRWNLYYALLVFGLAQTISNLFFVLLAVVGKSFMLMTISLFIENFCSGLSTAAFLAFIMSLCDHRYTATQFASFSAISSIGRVFLGPVAAFMVSHLGWVQFYWWSFVLCFPGLVFLLLLKNEVMSYAPATAK